MAQGLIAVDPGDKHVGVAFFVTSDPHPWTGEGGGSWECVDTQEFEPDEFADALAETMIAGEVDNLVVEIFRLYGDKAVEQTGSQFETSQLIGVIKYLVRINNLHVATHRALDTPGAATKAFQAGKPAILPCEQRGGTCANGSPYRHINLVMQPADIKKPTAGILRTKKMKSTAKAQKTGGHCFDAELHGWHYILRGHPRE